MAYSKILLRYPFREVCVIGEIDSAGGERDRGLCLATMLFSTQATIPYCFVVASLSLGHPFTSCKPRWAEERDFARFVVVVLALLMRVFTMR